MRGLPKAARKLVGALFLTGALYATWVGYPPSRYETQFQAVLQRQRDKRAADQKRARDPRQNGYLCLQQSPREALRRPYLLFPPTVPTASLLQLVADLDAQAFRHIGESRPYQAVEVATDLLLLSTRKGSLQDSLAALEVVEGAHRRSLQILVVALQHPALQAEAAQLASLATVLEREQLTEGTFAAALEGELLDSQTASHPCDVDWGRLVLRWPGVRQREYRLFKNEYMRLLEQARAGSDVVLPFSLRPTITGDWFWGRQCLLQQVFVDSPWTATGTLKDEVRRQAFVHLYVHLLMYRKNSDQWPADFRELEAQGFHSLPGLQLKQVDYQALGDNLQICQPGCPNPSPLSDEKRYQLEQRQWVLHQPDQVQSIGLYCTHPPATLGR